MSSLLVSTSNENPGAFFGWAAPFCPPEDPHITRVHCLDSRPERSGGSTRVIEESEPAEALLDLLRHTRAHRVVIEIDGREDTDSPQMQLAVALMKALPAEIVLLDRGLSSRFQAESVLLPVQMGTTWPAMDLAMRLVTRRGQVVPFYVAEGDKTEEQGRSELRRVLRVLGVERSTRIAPQAVAGEPQNRALRTAVGGADLLLLGTVDLQDLRDLRRGRAEKNMLPISREKPIVIAASPNQQPRMLLQRLLGRVLWLLPQMDRDERTALTDNLRQGAAWNVDFIVMMVLSTAIASLGLMQDSVAVVIGAMLVAPLMTPLIGAGWALTQGNVVLFRQSLWAMGYGVVGGFSLAFILGWAMPRDQLTPQIVARSTPDLLDLAVALASGVAAAYAMSRRNVSSALPGVAIAAALVPPLSSVGIAVAFQRWTVAEGAAILLLANLAAIILGAALTFRLLGARTARLRSDPAGWTRAALLTLVLLPVMLALPLWFQTQQNRLAGTAGPLLNNASPTMVAAILDYINEDDNISPLIIRRPSQEISSATDLRVVLVAREPVMPQIYHDIEAVVSDVLRREAVVQVIVLQDGWFVPPMSWQEMDPNLEEKLEHAPELKEETPEDKEPEDSSPAAGNPPAEASVTPP